MSDARLLQVQAVSGLVFLAFVLVHLANTAFALGGHLFPIPDPTDNDYARM